MVPVVIVTCVNMIIIQFAFATPTEFSPNGIGLVYSVCSSICLIMILTVVEVVGFNDERQTLCGGGG